MCVFVMSPSRSFSKGPVGVSVLNSPLVMGNTSYMSVLYLMPACKQTCI